MFLYNGVNKLYTCIYRPKLIGACFSHRNSTAMRKKLRTLPIKMQI